MPNLENPIAMRSEYYGNARLQPSCRAARGSGLTIRAYLRFGWLFFGFFGRPAGLSQIPASLRDSGGRWGGANPGLKPI
jgi:hypothetical protein